MSTSLKGTPPPARAEDELRLTGSVGANKVMASELLRLVKRSPFEVRLPKPRRDGSATLRYPFDPAVAWVAACYHRSCSSVSWELASSPAVRLEPLHADLVPLLAADERLPQGRDFTFSVEVRDVHDFEAGPLQVRGAVKSAVEDAARQRGATAHVGADDPELLFTVRRAGPAEERRTWVAIDLGGAGRHVRGHRAAVVEAPLRETLAAQLVLLSGWDARSEPLVDPMAGGATIAIEAVQLGLGVAVRQPSELRLSALAAFRSLKEEAPPLFPGTRPSILSCDVDPRAVPAMIGNLRSARLTGPEHEGRLVVADRDVRDLTPEYVAGKLPAVRPGATGVFCVNPPYGHRLQGGDRRELLRLYGDMGRALRRFTGWRASIFVANDEFVDAFGGRPSSSRPASNAGLRGEFHQYRF